MAESGSSSNRDSEQEFNRHFATSREQCIKMGKLNGWKFVKAKPSKFPDSILKVECFFEGEQTSFMQDD
jgi:hypothetical protein